MSRSREDRLYAEYLQVQRQNIAMVRTLRTTHGRVPQQVADFILQNPMHVPFKVRAWRWVEKVSVVLLFAVIVASASTGLSLASGGFQDATTQAIMAAMASEDGLYAFAAGKLSLQDLSGYLAAVSMLMTFSMTRAIPLRIFAIAANVFFLIYAIDQGLMPVLLLHAILLPMNLCHLVRAVRGAIAENVGRIEMDA